MKKLLGCLAVFLMALSFNTQHLKVNANTSDVKISQLEINNQNDFADLTGITSFVSFDNYVYYTVENALFCYNFTTKSVTALPYHSVTNLEQTNNLLAFLNANKLVILNKDGSAFNLDSPEISAYKFSINFSDDITTVSYINGSTMGIIKFNGNGETKNSFLNDIEINNVVSMAVTSRYTYIIYSVDNKNNFVKINNDVDFDKTEYTFVYLDCTNLEVIEESGTMLITHNGTSALAVLTEQNGELILQKDILIKSSTTPSFSLGDITDFTDVKVNGNNVLIADSRTNPNIQEFKLTNYDLIPNKILLSSTSYELGRFNNVTSVQVANNSTIYVADYSNRRIQTIIDGTASAKTAVESNSFENPRKVVTSDNINFYVLDNNKIYVYNDTTSYEVNAQNITDIAVTENNEVYAVSNVGIYKINAGSNQLTLIKSGYFINAHIGVCNKYLAVSFESTINIYSLNPEQLTYTTTLTSNIKDINTDFYNNLYLLTNNGVVKLNFNETNNNFASEITTLNINYNFDNINCFGINKVNGDLICFNNSVQTLIKIESNFVNKLTNFLNPVDPHNQTKLKTLIPYGKVSKTCYVFDYPYNTNFNYKLQINNCIYVLDSENYNNYYFVMYNNNNKICFGYVKKDNLLVFNQEQSLNTQVEAIYKNVKVYKYPTILRDNVDGFVLTNINQNNVITCVNKEVVSIDNSKYYAIKLEDGSVGYVNSSDVRDTTTSDIKALPMPNARLINDANLVNLYLNEDVNSYVMLELKQDSQFYVENYDANKPLTKISYVDDSKVMHTGYVETKYIVMEVNNPNLTAAYILLAIGIVLTIAGISVYVAYKKGKL